MSAMCFVIASCFSTMYRPYAVKSSVLFSDCEVCRVLSILCTCKTMRRTSLHHGADGFYLPETVSYQPGGRFLVAFNRRGYFSTKASSANCFGLVSGSGLSNNRLCRCAFSRWRSSMDNAISCNSSSVIVCTCQAMRRSTLRYSASGSYPSFREGYVNVFRTNSRINTSDHLSPKAVYTGSIPYKTGIGISTPLESKAIQTPHASFFVSAHTHTSTMVGCMGLPSGRLVTLDASSANPVQSTASELSTSGGGYIPTSKEAFHMAVSARPYFVWRFMQCQEKQTSLFTVTAATEREARAQLPHAHLIFVARIRQGVSHA
ncbi:host cell division inhibitor Icd-like protein [Escherichia coli]|nr:host cell division inhibitor Icd-like protein [Escherichia coli]EJN4029884.1 host cell division inhibitor Icd-like protein [Escherichia coli]EJN4353752.1 host cell division inhibitor Icd-like protein [Escherichia coli]EJN4461625.1 host cell division inhibitor Icd-like protein [Escherichia coli]EJP0095446.1 host cell division inhibitor Icd-like protein [Escherichia coli]